MKILLVNDHAEFGGAENYVQNLRSELEEKHEVALLTLDGSDKPEYTVEEKDSIIHQLKNRYLYSHRISGEVREVVEDFDPDVVHLNKNVVAPISVLKALESQKVVKTVHDFGFVSLNEKYAYEMNQVERRLRKSFDSATYLYLGKLRKKIIDQYTAPSEALTVELEKEGYAPVTCLPNFVSDREPSYGGEHFLFVGRLEEGKAPDLLVEAYSENLPPLEIVGKGKMKEELAKKAENLDNITVHGYVSEEKLEELYQNALAVVIPSRWRENNPLVALEAKAYGKPLIVSNRGGLPELVENGETGYIFESEDADQLKEKLSTDTDWETMGRNSREGYEQKYTPETHLQKLLEVYSIIQ